MFMNLAHRGASAYAPENTLAAFYKGIEMGANGIETDIKITKDGRLFLFHDDLLNRTTDGEGNPSDATWNQLEKLDAGSWYSTKYKGEKLVLFDQFLYIFGEKPLMFAFELKDRFIEKKVLELIEKYPTVFEKTTITSFDFRNLAGIKKWDKQVRIGYLTSRIDLNSIRKVKEIEGHQICPDARHVNTEAIELAKNHKLEVRAWGVTDEKVMYHAYKCGIDGMTVNSPDKLSHLLRTNE